MFSDFRESLFAVLNSYGRRFRGTGQPVTFAGTAQKSMRKKIRRGVIGQSVRNYFARLQMEIQNRHWRCAARVKELMAQPRRRQTGSLTSIEAFEQRLLLSAVTGTNDQPVAGMVSVSATEDGPAVDGNFSVTDVDTSDTHTFALTSQPAEGTVTLTASSDVWTQIGQDIDGEAEFDQSGSSVSLSADGSVVAIGAIYNDGNGNDSGHVRLYRNTGGTWTQIGEDIDGEAAGDRSGSSVSLSADGSVVAIGATSNDDNG
ncbi:MAG: hypothetical protein MK102_18790, partial [Fuerstiella sp.]|nr:hypothetical protein [Fuerstiella sp.]